MPKHKFTHEDLRAAALKRKRNMKSLAERLEDKIVRVPGIGCWIWTGAPTSRGYGLISFAGKRCLAHRVSYEMHRDQIPQGMVIDHLCKVQLCVNPAHLEVVTQGENVRRGNAGASMRIKTHCPQGHQYAGDNLRMYRGMRYCNTCLRESGKRRYREKRSAIKKLQAKEAP